MSFVLGIEDISPDMSFLEMMDVLNERIIDEVEDSTSVSDEIKAAVEQARTDTAQDLAEKDAALQFAKALLDDAGITFEQPFEEDSSKILDRSNNYFNNVISNGCAWYDSTTKLGIKKTEM